jgi:hypothetical protein
MSIIALVERRPEGRELRAQATVVLRVLFFRDILLERCQSSPKCDTF